MHKFIFPHRWNPWKLKLHATCLWGNPISGGFQLSQYPRMRWRLTRFCFVSPWRPRAALLSLYIEECLCVTALFPDESDVICRPSPSFTPPPPPSPSGLLPSLVRVREWRDSDVMGLRRLSRWIATLGDSPAHMHTQWMCDTQTHRQNHTCVHSPIFATHNRTHAWLYNRGFCRTHARSSELLGLSAEGRSIWHSVPAGNRPREASCFRCIHADLKRTHAPELFPTFHTCLFKHVSVITWSLFLPSTIKVVRFSHVNTSWACFKCLTCVQIWKCLWC